MYLVPEALGYFHDPGAVVRVAVEILLAIVHNFHYGFGRFVICEVKKISVLFIRTFRKLFR